MVTQIAFVVQLQCGFRGVLSCSSLGWPAGSPDLYLGGARIPDDIDI